MSSREMVKIMGGGCLSPAHPSATGVVGLSGASERRVANGSQTFRTENPVSEQLFRLSSEGAASSRFQVFRL